MGPTKRIVVNGSEIIVVISSVSKGTDLASMVFKALILLKAQSSKGAEFFLLQTIQRL